MRRLARIAFGCILAISLGTIAKSAPYDGPIEAVFAGSQTSVSLAVPELSSTQKIVVVVDNKGTAGTSPITIGGPINGGTSITLTQNYAGLIFQWNGREYNVIGSFNAGSAPSSGLTVGSSTISGGTNGRVLYDNAGALGELPTTGSGNVVLGTSPTLSNVTVSGSFTAPGLVTNADLANPATTVNGQICTLGSACTISASGVTVGTTAIGSGTSGRILYDNAGTLGELTPTGSGNVVLATSPTVSGLTVTGSLTATGLVTNANLANSATTVNGQTCTLGSPCTVTAAASGVTVATTTVGGGTSGRILYDNAGALGELTTTGSGSAVLATSPTISGATVTGSFTATGLVTNADLTNSATTVNGQTCTLGSPCTVTAAASGVTVGTTTVGGGTSGRVLYNNAGTMGELVPTGSGNVVLATSPTISGLTASGVNTFSGTVVGSHLDFSATGSISLGAACGKVVHYTGASAGTLTINSAEVADCNFPVVATSTGLATIAASGGSFIANTACTTNKRTKETGSVIMVHVISNAGSAPVVSLSGDCG